MDDQKRENVVVGRIEFPPAETQPPADGLPSLTDMERACRDARKVALDRLIEIGELRDRVSELEQALRTSQAELVEEHHVREACEVQLADRDRRIAALREVFRDE